MTKTLYLCDGISIHDKNFIKSLSEKIELDVLDLQDIGSANPTDEIHCRNPKSIIVTPIDHLLEFVPKNFQGSLIGISLAYDLNEIHTEQEKQDMMLKLSRLNGIVVDSEFTRKKLIKEFCYEGKILKIVYGIKTNKREINEEKNFKLNQIIVTRTWTPIHNNELILEAFLNLKSKHDLSITFIKPHDSNLIINEAFKHQLESDGVKFIEPMSNIALRQLLPNYGVYISASTSDGTSISLLEAMDANRICLVSDYPSNREIVVDGENGFLFENGNKRSLMQKILEIQALSMEEVRVIGTNAGLTVTKLANWEHHSRSLIEFCISFEEQEI